MRRLRRLLPLAGLVAVVAVAGPASSANPHASGAPGQAKQAEKGPKVDVTLRGTVVAGTDDQGRPTFTLSANGTTWELSAGPKWFYGDDSPLKAFVGQTVDVTGSHREGSTDVSVDTVNGDPLRAAGKPPWAGGPKVVGEGHPGWKPWHADGQPGNGLGREGAPGQQKDRSGDDTED
jgi:hypothetical protein